MKKVAFILFLVLFLAGKGLSEEQKEEGLKYMDEEEENEIKANSKADSQNKEEVKTETNEEPKQEEKKTEKTEEEKEETDLKADKHSDEEPAAEFSDDKPEVVNYERAAESEDMEQFEKQEELINDTYVYRDDDFENDPEHMNSPEMDSFLSEWEESMADYDPEYVYVFNLKGGETKEFFEDVLSDGTEVKGAFFVPGMESDSVNFEILNSKNELLYNKQSRNGIFSIKLEYKDLLRVVVKNNANNDVEFTISMNIGHNAIVKQNDLVRMDDKMNLLVTNVNRMILEMKIKRNNYEDREKRNVLSRNQENEPARLHFLYLRDLGVDSPHSIPTLLPKETI